MRDRLMRFRLRTALWLSIGLALAWSPSAPCAGRTAKSNSAPPRTTHPISVVEADIYVGRFTTTMKLTCFAEDLEMLQGVEALEDGFYDPEELREATQDHAQFLAKKIILRNAEGEKLPAKIVEIVDFDIPDDGIRAGTLMNYKMKFVFEYRYDQPPKFLTVEQNMVAEGALLPSELNILLKQAGIDAPYTCMMKPGEPRTFSFDWNGPVLDEDSSKEEWKKWFETRRKESLGIVKYSSVYSFIYINDQEVRHEILIPLATLATFIDIRRADESFLDIDEQGPAAEKIKAFFSKGNPVVIDSVEVKPVFDRVDFYGLDLKDFAVRAPKRRVSMASGRVGIIMTYSTQGPPTTVDVTWDKFNDVMRSVDSVVFPYDQVEKTKFSKFLENNTYHWQQPDRKPLPPITGVTSSLDLKQYEPKQLTFSPVAAGLAIGALLLLIGLPLLGSDWKTTLIGSGLCLLAAFGTITLWPITVARPFSHPPPFQIDDETADQIFAQLHKNIFRAFDYRKERDVYDSLAKSVEGPLLRKLYLDINRSLRVANQGGAVSRITAVQLLEGHQDPTIPLPPGQPAFGYRCKWNLVGTIEHWGHIHERTNQYDAQFVVQVVDDAWKIVSMEIVDEAQGQVKVRLRKL